MHNAYIEIAYELDGRIVEGPCSGLAKYVVAGLAKPRTAAGQLALDEWVAYQGDDDREIMFGEAEELAHKHGLPWSPSGEGETPADEPEPVTTDDTPSDGWPPGVTYYQTGAYFTLTGSDGNAIDSGTASGKFRGENAAQEAAWRYETELRTR